MNEISPPSVSKQAEDPEMTQWAYEATAAIDAADKAAKNTLERYKEAGEALAKAKKKCGHGKWIPWLKRNGISTRTAGRALKVFASWAKLANLANLSEAMKVMADAGEESEKTKPVEVAPLCDGCQRKGPRKDCKACEEIEAEWKSKKNGKKDTEGREPGDDTDQIEKDKEDEKTDPKSGKPKFDYSVVPTWVGKGIREADRLAKAYSDREAKEFVDLRQDIIRVRDKFTKLYEKHSGLKAPLETNERAS